MQCSQNVSYILTFDMAALYLNQIFSEFTLNTPEFRNVCKYLK